MGSASSLEAKGERKVHPFPYFPAPCLLALVLPSRFKARTARKRFDTDRVLVFSELAGI